MPVALTVKPNEESTLIATVSFKDEAGTALIPTSVTWTLSKPAPLGTVINDRLDVSLTPAASISWAIYGDDLQIDDGAQRVITVKATYNSTYGTGLPINGQASFSINDLVAVT